MKKHLLFFLLLLGFYPASAQEEHPEQLVTLAQIIARAQQNSLTVRRAETSQETSFWQWRTYLADYKPTLRLTGTLPDFNRSINAVTQPDGTTDFRQVSIHNALLDVGISQPIGLTGGQVFVSSQLQRFDDFNAHATRYNSNPALIGFSQPLFQFNPLAWARKIEPLRYAESQKKFVEDREMIAQDITQLYFDLLLQQVNQSIATKNRTNTEAIIRIAEEKFKLGKISKSDVLQLRLSLLNSQIAQAEADLAVKNAALALNSYLGETAAKPLLLAVPGDLPLLAVTENQALEQARQNRKESLAFKRTLLQAERDLAEARRANGFNATMFATFGLTNQATNLLDSYGNPQNQQRIRVGFELPVMDGGKQKSLRKTAQANLKLAQYAVEQDQLEFEQRIRTQVNQFEMLKTRVAITTEADQIAQSRYDIAKATYVIGRISITDLNIALGEKDQAKRAYISSLRDFWIAFYNLRLLTLYDFEKYTVNARTMNSFKPDPLAANRSLVAEPAANIITLTDIEKVYQTKTIETVALHHINLDIRKGEFVSIMGPSGCGKSTLLNIMGLLDEPTRGLVAIGGAPVRTFSDQALARLRNQKIGFVFQSYHLINDLSVTDNVELPLLYRSMSGSERRRRALEALDKVGLSARTSHYPNQLSGGQRQRVAIARALAGEPEIILADEPTGNLDSVMGHEIMDILLRLNQAENTTIVMVTHDEGMAKKTQRLIRLFDGSQVL